MKRRTFLHRSLTGGLLLSCGRFPLNALEEQLPPEIQKLTILHTNDVHSRVEPFPAGSRYAGLGGAARRAALLREIRQAEEHVLLLDAGDIFQGTPYFNFFQGEIEFRLMSAMDYDAATIGNHDFDAGIERLAEATDQHARFPFVNCNYDFRDTPMAGKVRDSLIITKGDLRIGITGVGIELRGLVPDAWYGNTRYLKPVENLNQIAARLKKEEKCDYVICLSHLGYKYNSQKISDLKLAAQSRNVDLIIGGHTHTFLDEPSMIRNIDGEPVLINQVGWAGIVLGRIDVLFERNRKGKCESCNNVWVTNRS